MIMVVHRRADIALSDALIFMKEPHVDQANISAHQAITVSTPTAAVCLMRIKRLIRFFQADYHQVLDAVDFRCLTNMFVLADYPIAISSLPPGFLPNKLPSASASHYQLILREPTHTSTYLGFRPSHYHTHLLRLRPSTSSMVANLADDSIITHLKPRGFCPDHANLSCRDIYLYAPGLTSLHAHEHINKSQRLSAIYLDYAYRQLIITTPTRSVVSDLPSAFRPANISQSSQHAVRPRVFLQFAAASVLTNAVSSDQTYQSPSSTSLSYYYISKPTATISETFGPSDQTLSKMSSPVGSVSASASSPAGSASSAAPTPAPARVGGDGGPARGRAGRAGGNNGAARGVGRGRRQGGRGGARDAAGRGRGGVGAGAAARGAAFARGGRGGGIARPRGRRARRPSPAPSSGASSSEDPSSSDEDSDDGVSDASSRSVDGGDNPRPAIYRRRNEVDWRDPVVQAEMLELGFDPARPYSPLAADELPRFLPEPQPAPYLELTTWQLGPVGLLYPEADFLVCRLPVSPENQVLLIQGRRLAQLGVLSVGEPMVFVADPGRVGEPGEDGRFHVHLDFSILRFGVTLVRRDWPQGEVATLFDGEVHTQFVRRMFNTFGSLPRERLVWSEQVLQGTPTRAWLRAFMPVNVQRQPSGVQRIAWVVSQLGVIPEDPWQRQQMIFAAAAADPWGGAPAAGDA
ncbi:hypothetical protein V8F33_005754 [Rhypophila sp. PSN 637]